MSQHRFLQQILYQALAQPYGLLLSAEDPLKMQQKLYAAKYTAKDLALAGLEIKLSPIEGGELVIYDKKNIQALLAPPIEPISPKPSREEDLFDNMTLESLGVAPENKTGN